MSSSTNSVSLARRRLEAVHIPSDSLTNGKQASTTNGQAVVNGQPEGVQRHDRVQTRSRSRARRGNNGRFKRDYINIAFLGKGAYGAVFRATHKLDKKTCAIKCVRASSVAAGQEKEDKCLEAYNHARLKRHPNLVQMHTCWPEDDDRQFDDLNFKLKGSKKNPIFFMELEICDGTLCTLTGFDEECRNDERGEEATTIPDWMAAIGLPLTLNHIFRIARDLLVALDCIHSCQLCHLDLHDENILFRVDKDNRRNPIAGRWSALVSDLGCSKRVDQEPEGQQIDMQHWARVIRNLFDKTLPRSEDGDEARDPMERHAPALVEPMRILLNTSSNRSDDNVRPSAKEMLAIVEPLLKASEKRQPAATAARQSVNKAPVVASTAPPPLPTTSSRRAIAKPKRKTEHASRPPPSLASSKISSSAARVKINDLTPSSRGIVVRALIVNKAEMQPSATHACLRLLDQSGGEIRLVGWGALVAQKCRDELHQGDMIEVYGASVRKAAEKYCGGIRHPFELSVNDGAGAIKKLNNLKRKPLVRAPKGKIKAVQSKKDGSYVDIIGRVAAVRHNCIVLEDEEGRVNVYGKEENMREIEVGQIIIVKGGCVGKQNNGQVVVGVRYLTAVVAAAPSLPRSKKLHAFFRG